MAPVRAVSLGLCMEELDPVLEADFGDPWQVRSVPTIEESSGAGHSSTTRSMRRSGTSHIKATKR